MNIKYHNSKQTKKILFLSEIHDGGEWIATNRLAGAILKSKDVMFSNSLIAFANIKFVNNFFIQASLIKHPTEKRPFSFIKNSIKDFLKLKNELQKSKDKFDIVLVSYYFAMLPLLLARKTKRNNIYYLFHGTRSVPFFSKLGFNYRNLIVLLIEFISLILTKKIIVPSKEAKNFLLLRFKHVLKNKKIYILPNYVPDFFYKRSIKSSEVLSFIDNKISKKLSVITY